MSNGCVHCGALLGRFYEHDAWYCEEETVATIAWRPNAEEKCLLDSDTERWAVWEGNPMVGR